MLCGVCVILLVFSLSQIHGYNIVKLGFQSCPVDLVNSLWITHLSPGIDQIEVTSGLNTDCLFQTTQAMWSEQSCPTFQHYVQYV